MKNRKCLRAHQTQRSQAHSFILANEDLMGGDGRVDFVSSYELTCKCDERDELKKFKV